MRISPVVKWSVTSYLVVSLIVLLVTWNGGWSELGPRWLCVHFLSWPFTGLIIDGISSLGEAFGAKIDFESRRQQFMLIPIILFTGAIYWACLAWGYERVNRWRK